VRTEWLTPYDAETIAEDVLRQGRGARLDVVVPADASAAQADEVVRRFAPFRARGVDVAVRRADDATASPAVHGRAGAGGP
jgi:hypothetical protein